VTAVRERLCPKCGLAGDMLKTTCYWPYAAHIVGVLGLNTRCAIT
jgi:hypothetical protein